MRQKYYIRQNCKVGMIQGEAAKATRLQIERLHSFPFRFAVLGRKHNDDDGDYDCEALWHKEKTLPKGQRTLGILSNATNLGRTLAWFCLIKGKRYILQF